MERIEQDETIDLQKLFAIIADRRKLLGVIVAGFTAVALIISLLLPKEYTSQVTVQAASGDMGMGGAAAAMAAITGGGVASGKAATYMELMKTRVVLEPIIEQVFDDIEPEKRPDAEGFVKKNLDIANTKGTQLISVEAKGRTPEEAKYIADTVVSNFLCLMTNLNKENKSLVVSFLDERIATAKKEADESAKALEEYSKAHKLYGPEAQTSAQLSKSAAYDKTLGELAVTKMAQQARLSSVASQLGEQNSDAMKYNMADAPSVQRLHNAIIDKETELVKMRMLYQEKHPSVVRAIAELEELNNQLSAEVQKVVSSQAVNVNENQKSLQMARYQAATALAVANASEAKVKALQAKADEDMAGMADDILEYKKLAREAGLKQEIYNNLTKQIENAKIQQTMESMDIQVVDPANLPDEDKPSGPRKKLITLAGMVLGCMVSLGYSLVLYRKTY
ncbi:MAG: Wzz/FepE/Etk N-terminal domain-containing protein [Selenomonadaceae bacterium]|nr:Wzz/FepE/Etk N-terminal domain-containing protein [Selenomonadaceae bacterium]